MKRMVLPWALVILCSFGLVGLSVQPSLAYSEYVADANTVLLDHFNGSTVANYTGGSPTYGSSAPGLNQAINLTSGTYLRYDLASWNSSAGGTEELWVHPDSYNKTLITLQWNNASSPPPAGYIGAFYINSAGKIATSEWASGALVGNASLPLNQWSHVAFTWGPSGSNLYINGQLDAHTAANLYPHMLSTTYAYINDWGSPNLGYIDELRISNMARTEFSTVPLPASIFLLGSGLVGLGFLGRRRLLKRS